MFRCFFLHLILSHHLYGLYVVQFTQSDISSGKQKRGIRMDEAGLQISFVSDVT